MVILAIPGLALMAGAFMSGEYLGMLLVLGAYLGIGALIFRDGGRR